MLYSPELREAMKEIEAVIEKYDVAAYIILNKPGFTEYKLNLTPSFSCAKLLRATDGQIQAVKIDNDIKDCGGDKEKWMQRGADTAAMFQHISHVGKMHMDWLTGVTAKIEREWHAHKLSGIHSERK